MSSLRTEVSTANEAAAAESSGVTETTGTTSTVEDRHNISTDYEPANHPAQVHTICPALTLEAPTPIYQPVQSSTPDDIQAVAEPSHSNLSLQSSARQSHHELPVNAHTTTLLDPEAVAPSHLPTGSSNFSAAMLNRKIWVKRPNASATLVQIREDDLVDDVRDMILRKYGNSLGRSFDAPDILLRIVPRDSTAKAQDRVLGPEEEMCRTLDAYYPGGQNVNEALIIEVPKPRTPKPSPRIPVYYTHNDDSAHHLHQQSDYFPPMPVVNPSPAALSTISHERPAHAHAPHSIAVLQTSQLPPLPSPGGRRPAHALRPKNARHATASPITLSSIPHSSTSNRPSNRPRHDSSASESKHSATNAPVPTPPVPAESSAHQNSTPPTPRLASPRPIKKPKKPKAADSSNLPAGLLDGSVPPINVLIVEDNIINLRVLGAFMQRLKVRWQKAMDGREAVTKWRTGGFHLVLMDIQLPIMDGLEATREIRRLERVNSIGVFSSGSSEAPNNRLDNGNYGSEIKEDDKLGDRSLFKSPVIIVALTASSLQSDRHEALAAGCNDFLTKVSQDNPLEYQKI
jgi:osomolarity two-component system response regulator SSK1